MLLKKEQLLIQSSFDGEASPEEDQLVQELCRTKSSAREYLQELKRVRGEAQSSFQESAMQTDWLALQHRINSSQSRTYNNDFSGWYKLSISAVLLLVLMALPFGLREEIPILEEEVFFESTVYSLDSIEESASQMVFHDAETGWTVVWVLSEET